MDEKTKAAFKWALSQNHSSVAATHARTIAEYLMDLEEMISGIERAVPNWRNYRDLAEAVEVAVQRSDIIEGITFDPVFHDVLDRRRYQDSKWGGAEHDDQHDPGQWCKWIRGYVSWAEVMVDFKGFGKYRRRMIDVAALAISAVQSLDRLLKRDRGVSENSQAICFCGGNWQISGSGLICSLCHRRKR